MKESVRTRYLSSIRRFDEHFGSLLVASITTRDIADWISDRKRNGSIKAQGKGKGKAISNASIQRDLTALSRLLSFCCSIGWRTDNPVQAFDRTIIRERREPKRPPTRKEIQTAIDAAPPGIAGILTILAETGMRMNEAVMLERWQVDSRSHQILLTKTKTSRPHTINWHTSGEMPPEHWKTGPHPDFSTPAAPLASRSPIFHPTMPRSCDASCVTIRCSGASGGMTCGMPLLCGG
ncbi:tyrosine-type recombinase/integrase [Komagataeibacter saccharivorans]|uniref:tyrosine-type recombinase/integrase n=1 Tax=Komagataeibacter saccharivorans TaxID=265959 RepID=UPI002156A431|nr:hypothetical protein [Komagataeibacter saccharivorans]GBQ36466.1 hypothetical protein AA0614_0720 [Komagataeibacter saccharivorans NRIC 0614]